MKSPIVYYGNKAVIAAEVWKRFGTPTYYYEPFAGALGVLLGRPDPGKYEFVGDIYCEITNLFRAAKFADPNEFAELADWPSSQLDLQARTRWLKEQRERLHEGLTNDPHWYDLKCAAWYAWSQSVRISTNGTKIILGRRAGVRRTSETLKDYLTSLKSRLQNVTIDYGDWQKSARSARSQSQHSDCAILLDPPYGYKTLRQKNLYVHDSPDVSDSVRRWALAVATTRPRLRIALCGLDGEHRMPSDWEELPWKSRLGEGNERIWFSPNCQIIQ